MGKKEDILNFCKTYNREVTAREILDALYPGKHQSYVNSEINYLVTLKALVRNDTQKPYTVRLPYEGELISEVKDYSWKAKENITSKQTTFEDLSAEKAVALIKAYHNEIIYDSRDRYMSWVHCYRAFQKYRGAKDGDTIDLLSLNLGFYLASWGMLRSSFLLQKDYAVHQPVVEIILEGRYEPLWGIIAKDLKIENNLNLISEISERIRNAYAMQTPAEPGKINHATDTLITKILLGTFGCTPAFDRYFVDGLKSFGFSTATFRKTVLNELADFYIKNEAELERLRKDFEQSGFDYPAMKLLDMCLWQAEFSKDMAGK